MIIDNTGTILTPGNAGKACLGNGEQMGIECCCDGCDYMICCLESHSNKEYSTCSDRYCPRSPNCCI